MASLNPVRAARSTEVVACVYVLLLLCSGLNEENNLIGGGGGGQRYLSIYSKSRDGCAVVHASFFAGCCPAAKVLVSDFEPEDT